MGQQMGHVTDARYSTHNSVGGDQINNHYTVSHIPAPPPSSLSFNDAPIDLLSSHFTGREEELDSIGRALGVHNGNVPVRCIIQGMAGIGKTQLILRYVKLSFDRQQYSIVFWISGATVEKANQGLAKVLALVGHPDRDHQDQSIRLTTARRWLEESNTDASLRWLLVLDNVAPETVGFLKEHLPRQNSSGNILLTTRTGVVAEALASVAGKQHQIFELRAPDLRNAANQLLHEAGINVSGAATDNAEALVKCIGCLPLAISQAASFAKKSLMNLDDVLSLYKSNRKYEMISWSNIMSNYEQESVAVTFATQLNELESQSPDCANFLKVLSFFDPEFIPVDMIAEGAKQLQFPSGLDMISSDISISPELKSLADLLCSPVQRHAAIQQFHQLSLVRHESTKGTVALRIHDLIQIMIQESAKIDGRQHRWFSVAAMLVCGAFRNIDDPRSHLCWARCETLTPHIQALTRWNDEHSAGNSGLEEVNIGIAQYLSSRGRFHEAETLFEQALAGHERVFGPEHPGRSGILEQLAIIYQQQARYKEAETLFGQVLGDDIFGDESIDKLRTVHNLAAVYRYRGRYNEANTLYERVLEARERLLGPVDPDTLHTVNNLAIICRLRGQYSESETLCKRALAGRETLLGLEHPDTLHSVNSLALVYKLQRRYKEAETLSMRAMEGREKLLGPEHPETLVTVHNLAAVYQTQGRYQEAEKLYGQAAAAKTKVYGREHPTTLLSLNNLAVVCLLQGRPEEAEKLSEEVLAGYVELLGSEHPDTLRTMDTLARTYSALGRYNEAEPLHWQVLAGFERVLGLEHPDTQLGVRHLVDFFEQQGRHKDKFLVQVQFPLAFESP